MVDVLVRQDGVEQSLDGREGRVGAQHARVQLIHHLRIGQLRQARQPARGLERHRREAAQGDGLEVRAAALHVQDFDFLAEDVLLAQLDRGVAAAMQDERLVASQEARGIDPQRQRPGELRRFRVVPKALHRNSNCLVSLSAPFASKLRSA